MQKSFTAKLWKVMKICAAQTLIALTLCGVSLAHSNYAQILDQQITISLTDVPFEEALKKIEQAAKVKFAFSTDQLEDEEPVSVNANDRSLRDLLEELLSPRNIGYKVHEREKMITLKKFGGVGRNQSYDSEKEPAMKPFVLQVTGIVTDAVTNQPMAGVNIIVKGTARGTTSDADGRFAIGADAGEVLVFSFIGYAPFEMKLSGQTQLEIELTEDITSLKEVVVNAGYWTVKKAEQTGNITRIDSKDIERQPVMNSIAALQARVPGLEIIQQTGVPGGNYKVRIRGQNSIASGSDPLYVIDGVPFTASTLALNETTGEILANGTNPLNSINPADIESIEVLKDADATAIYGSRGANGVILITTKKGVAGKSRVNLNFYRGFSRVANQMSLLSTEQYLLMRHEAFNNDGIATTQRNAPDLFLWDTTRYTDWQKELIGGTASTTDAQLNFSGGDQNTQFLIGAGYHRETTVFPGDFSEQRFSTHMNFNNTSPNGKFKINVSANYSNAFSDLLKQDLTRYALTLAPNAPELYDNNGNLNWETSTWENPLSYLRRTYEGTTKNLITNATMSYSILPQLELRANIGYTDMTMKAVTATPKSSFNPAFIFVDNSAAFSTSNFENWIVEPQITWKNDAGGGSFNVLAGTTFLKQNSEALSQTGFGFLSESLIKNLQAASSSFISTNTYADYRYTAIFGRVNYILNGKYIVNLTGRRDGSSRFGPGKQFANFGAIGLAWIFTKERLFDNISFFSFGKIRTSYGLTGNDQISDYGFLDTYSPTGSYMETPGLAPTRLFNPEFGWETNKKFEAAIELGLLEDRLLFNLSHYRNRSSNLLVAYALPPTTGFSSIQGNLPALVENTGWEFEMYTLNVDHERFNWSTSLNFTVPKNKLVDFPDLASSAYANTYVIGQPLTITRSYHYVGIDASTGLYQFEDISKDGTISSLDRQITKYLGPRLYGGLSNKMIFKGLELDILFQFVNQSGYNYLVSGWSALPGRLSNQPALVMDRWTPESTNPLVQQFSTTSVAQTAYSRFRSSDHLVDDASFIRLKNVSLAYSLSDNLKNKLNLTDGKVFIQGQNLFTMTKYEGLDPESQSSALPPLQTLTAGFSISF